MPRSIARYGWIPDLPDQRDRRYSAEQATLQSLPRDVDLRPRCPAVYDQGQLGSCTANAIAGAMEFLQMEEQLSPVFTPSRLFIYYNEREIEGTVGTDSGASLRDGMKSVASQGAPPEADWPYDPARFAERPPESAYQAAEADRALLYLGVPRSLVQMRACLASGYPFAFGFTVYEGFEGPEVARTGVASLPGYGESVVGGHAVLAVGYDDDSARFLVRNSWGPGWGMGGYFTMPFAYLTDPDLSNSFWTIRVVE
ncbi:C1 family peptidase [Tautonia plasticadhaerens]|uniref:Papain family cysteine protease n=1 Tax=Tautonia plasticadhaerens TaxID=2527974 RepID=A0A518H4X6_9BACT|nr:C1 family peptidase [Tautonia plasticadhaerens]QDV35877.1 Papain family cysteine protease [Tautonia plasticadhaerens]